MFFLHRVPPPPVLYVADGVQTSQGAEAAKGLKEKKKDSETHIFLQTIRWTADVWRLAMVPPATTAPLKRRVRSCLTLDKPSSCHGMIYGACLWDFMFLGTWQWKPHPFCPSASSPGVHGRIVGCTWYSTASLWSSDFPSILDTWTDSSAGFLVLGSVPFLPDTCSRITLKLSLTKSLKAKQLCGRIQLHIENSCFQAFFSFFKGRKDSPQSV